MMLHRYTQTWEDAIHAYMPVSDPELLVWPATEQGQSQLQAAHAAREGYKPKAALTNMAAWVVTKALLIEPEAYTQQYAAAQVAFAQASSLAEAHLNLEPQDKQWLDITADDGTRFHLYRQDTGVPGFVPPYDMYVSLDDEQRSLPINFEPPSRAYEHYTKISDTLQAIAASRQTNQLFA